MDQETPDKHYNYCLFDSHSTITGYNKHGVNPRESGLNNINFGFNTPHRICCFDNVQLEVVLTIMGHRNSVLGTKPLITPTIKVRQPQLDITRCQSTVLLFCVHFIQYTYGRLDKIIFQFFNPTFETREPSRF